MLKSIRVEYRPFVILCAGALLVHLVLPLNWSDDAVFAQEASEMTLAAFLKGSSRLLTDAMTYLFARYHLLWRLCNPVVLTVMAIAVSQLLTCKNVVLKNTVICAGVVYPAMVLVDAGFIATTVNYLWPVTCGLLCLLPLKRLCMGGRVRWYELAMGIPLLLYALNMEQMCAILTVLFTAGFGYLCVKKRPSLYAGAMALLCVVGLCLTYFLNVMGDGSRMEREIARYFPDFLRLSLWNKLELGFSSTLYCLTMDAAYASAAFFAFSLFLAVAVFRKTKKTGFRFAAAVPPVFTVFFVTAGLLPAKLVPFLPFFTGGMQNVLVSRSAYSFSPVRDILLLAVCACVLCSVGRLMGGPRAALTAYVTLAAGLGSRMLMGFSPTVWASGYRTFHIMLLTFLFCAVMVLHQNSEIFSKKRKNGRTRAGLTGGFCAPGFRHIAEEKIV